MTRTIHSPSDLGITFSPGKTSENFFVKSNSSPADALKKTLSLAEYDENLAHIFEEIARAQPILTLEDDRDSDGALPMPKDVFYGAVQFLLLHAKHCKENGIIIESPGIGACSNESIDLEWRTPEAMLLINIEKEANQLKASYYGESKKTSDIIKHVGSGDTIHANLADRMQRNVSSTVIHS